MVSGHVSTFHHCDKLCEKKSLKEESVLAAGFVAFVPVTQQSIMMERPGQGKLLLPWQPGSREKGSKGLSIASYWYPHFLKSSLSLTVAC